MDKEIKIPPFVQDYIDKLDGDGFTDFVKNCSDYQKEREKYPDKFATQSAHLEQHNRVTGQNRKLNYEDGLQRIEADFRKNVYQTAKKHGFTGTDPNQPSDKEFTKQGAKFQDMIDHARQRQQQQEQAKQSEQKRDSENINTLKDQQPYQQNQPKVDFKGVEQQPSGTQEQSREQQRAAFLEQIKKTREQQTQQQKDKQHEI